ncbi:MAG: hypothetical protein ACYDC8_03030 [Gammaproteobacteria bacterium]
MITKSLVHGLTASRNSNPKMDKSMKLKQLIALSVTAALFSVSSLAYSASVAYTNKTAFNNALNVAGLTGVTQDFTAAAAANGVTDTHSYGVGDPNPITVGLASFAGRDNGLSNGSAGFLSQNTYGITGAFYTHQLFSEKGDNLVKITFAAPIKAFGFDNSALNLGSPFVWPTSGNTNLTLTTDGGDVLVFQSPISSIYGLTSVAPTAFSGLISDTAFTSVTLAGPTAIGLQITDFTVAAVPVPAAVWLLGSGILGLIGVAGRKEA